MDSFSSEDPRDIETSTLASASDVGFLPLAIGPTASIGEEVQEGHPPLGLLPATGPLPGGSFVEGPGWKNLGMESPSLARGCPFHSCTILSRHRGQEEGEPGDGTDQPGAAPAQPLQEVLELLRSTGPTQPQLRELEYQVLGFRDRLKVRVPTARRPSPAGSVSAKRGLWGQPDYTRIPASALHEPGGRFLSGPQFSHLSSGDSNSPHCTGRRMLRGGRGSPWVTCSTSSQGWVPSRIF